MWAVFGFILLVGLLILRMIEEQRRELQRTKSRLPKPHASSKKQLPHMQPSIPDASSRIAIKRGENLPQL
jgi:hypothetical protein